MDRYTARALDKRSGDQIVVGANRRRKSLFLGEADIRTAGLNAEVFDALILVAAGAVTPVAIATGARRVRQLMRDMHVGRYTQLIRLGFPPDEAALLASLHTRNFI